MDERFLLYIDILGFSDMVAKEPRKVARVYAILNLLNVHRHQSFKTIVFSDTVLVYNIEPALTDKDREYYVWFLTEFAEDLHHKLTGQDIYFRAMLVAGDFSHYQLENVECFFGMALINAYNAEKGIPSLGLFMDSKCAEYNRFFRLAPFSQEFSFVYLSRSLEHLNEYSGGSYPVDIYGPGENTAPFAPWQVRFLRDIHHEMRNHPSPHVRAKFLTAWDFYFKRYPEMLQALLQQNFDLNALGYQGAWALAEQTMKKDIRHFKRIGSGTAMSMTLTGSSNRPSKPLPVLQTSKTTP